MLLHPNCGGISRRMGIHGPDDGSDRRFLVIAGRRMCDVGTQEDDRFVEDLRADGGHQDAVDTAQFHVDFEA